MRTFIALNLPIDVLSNIELFTQECRNIQQNGIKYVLPENLHITLKFLGECSHETVESLSNALSKITCSPFEVQVREVGGFPDTIAPKVLWLGIDGGENLLFLHKQIEDICTGLEIETEARPFSPHLTIARVKGKIQRELTQFFYDNKNTHFGTFWNNSFNLFSSKLMSNGPVYSLVRAFSI